MSKFVMVQFPDATDTSTLVVDAVVTVGAVAGGTVIMAGSIQNPPVQTLISHTHIVPAGSGSLVMPPAATGPPIP